MLLFFLSNEKQKNERFHEIAELRAPFTRKTIASSVLESNAISDVRNSIPRRTPSFQECGKIFHRFIRTPQTEKQNGVNGWQMNQA